MNSEEADEILREFVVKQYVEMKLQNDGTIIYEFFDASEDRKESDYRYNLRSDDREIQ